MPDFPKRYISTTIEFQWLLEGEKGENPCRMKSTKMLPAKADRLNSNENHVIIQMSLGRVLQFILPKVSKDATHDLLHMS